MTSEYRNGDPNSFRNAKIGDYNGELLGVLHYPYDTVQPVAMRAMSERADYQELLAETPAVMEVLSREELDSCFTLEYYLKNVDFIFDRVGIE